MNETLEKAAIAARASLMENMGVKHFCPWDEVDLPMQEGYRKMVRVVLRIYGVPVEQQ